MSSGADSRTRASTADREDDSLLNGNGSGHGKGTGNGSAGASGFGSSSGARDLYADSFVACVGSASGCATPALVMTIVYSIGWCIGEIWALVLYTNHRNDTCRHPLPLWLGVAGGTGLFASFVGLCLWSAVVASLGPKANGEVDVSHSGGASTGCLMAAVVLYAVTSAFGMAWLIYGSTMAYGKRPDTTCAVYSFVWHYTLLWWVLGAAYVIALLIAYGACKKDAATTAAATDRP